MPGFNWLRRFRDNRPQRPAPRRRVQPFGSSEIVVAATKPQGPLVQVVNGVTGAVVNSFYPFVPQMTTGLFVTAVVR